MNRTAKMRVGVVVESSACAAWHVATVKTIHDSGLAEITLLVVGERRAGGLQHVGRAFLMMLMKWIGRRNAGLPRDPCEPVAIDEYLREIDRLNVDHVALEDPRQLTGLGEACSDVILCFVDDRRIAAWRSLARLGVWRFEADDGPFIPADGSLVGVDAVLLRKPVLLARLVAVGPDRAAPRVLYESVSAVDWMSHDQTRAQHLWKSSLLPRRALAAAVCHRKSTDTAHGSSPTAQSLMHENRRTRFSAVKALAAIPSYALWRLRQKRDRQRYRERWMLMSCARDDDDLPSYTRITPPPGRFWADPRVVEHDGAHFVFFEDASMHTGKGHISVAEVLDDGRLSRVRTALSRPYHLSYPFVFHWDGSYFMIPETADNGTIELYRCRRFPDQWEFSHNLMENVRAYDATLFQHDDRWWMYANLREVDGVSSWDELHVFWAEAPVSDFWTPHLGNPVISDVRRARPGGALFIRDGRIYRPSQDSSGRYGRALNINEVLELSPTHYREKLVRQYSPDSIAGCQAVHTYSRAGRISFVDAIIREATPDSGVSH
jgi:hypothetical protein